LHEAPPACSRHRHARPPGGERRRARLSRMDRSSGAGAHPTHRVPAAGCSSSSASRCRSR